MTERHEGAWRSTVRECAALLGYVLLKLGLVLLMAAMVFLVPVLLPVASALSRLDRRRMQAVADRTACLRCGWSLGREALEIADEAWLTEVRSRFAGRPTVVPRVVRTLDAVCPKCGARYRYDGAVRLFCPAPDPPAPAGSMAAPDADDPPPVLGRQGPG